MYRRHVFRQYIFSEYYIKDLSGTVHHESFLSANTELVEVLHEVRLLKTCTPTHTHIHTQVGGNDQNPQSNSRFWNYL